MSGFVYPTHVIVSVLYLYIYTKCVLHGNTDQTLLNSSLLNCQIGGLELYCLVVENSRPLGTHVLPIL